jgi:selenide,water dikinase
MAGAMLEREELVRQLRADGMVQAEIMERQGEGSKKPRTPFDPASLKLSSTFRLTKYAELRGRSCKMPTAVLEKMLEGLQHEKTKPVEDGVPARGLGMDAMISPIRLGGLSCIQTTHTSYPIVSDPFVQGRLSAVALLSSMFAVGVTSIDNVMLVLTVSTKMTELERDVVIPLLLQGFKEAVKEAGSSVSGEKMYGWVLFLNYAILRIEQCSI